MDVEKTIEFLLETGARHDREMGELKRQMSRLIGVVEGLAGHVSKIDGALAALAEAQIRTDARLDRVAEEFRDRDRILDDRINKMVSAIGEISRPLPAN